MGKVMGAWSWAWGISSSQRICSCSMTLSSFPERVGTAGAGEPALPRELGPGGRGAREVFLPPQPIIWGFI